VKSSAITPGIVSAIERPIHHGVYRPFGGGRRKSLSSRFADILKGRTAIAYDPQDLTTLFQDAAGTLPVYRPGTGLVDPPVGLMLDKSGGGYHASQSTTTARPTLSGRCNLLTATETLHTQSVTTVATNYTLRFEGAGTITLSGTATGTYSAGTHTITCTAGTLTCTVAGVVTRADLRVKRDGSSLPAYQSVTDANTYDTAGFPLFLKRDKVDDVLTCVAPAITGSQGMGSTGGAVLGPVIIPAGTYTPLSESATTGIPEITRYVAIDGTLTASERAVVERYLALTSPGQPTISPAAEAVFSFGLDSVSTFTFILQTKDNYSPVLVDWGDGHMSAHVGIADQTAVHTYAVSGTYAVKVYGADESVLTKFFAGVGGMSGTLSLPYGMTYFRCTESNNLTGTLSLPAGMTYFHCRGLNTLTGTLSLPSGMTFFDCEGSNTFSGTLILPAGMTYFNCFGSNTLSGPLQLPASMTYFRCIGSNTLTGTLSLPADMTYFYCTGSNTLTGTLSLPSGMTYFICIGSNTLSGYTPAAKASNQQRFYIAGLNTMSAADVDNILIDYAAAGGTWAVPKEITIQGNAADRTSASDAAYASLATKLTTLSVD
jgi:hypothetical protein